MSKSADKFASLNQTNVSKAIDEAQAQMGRVDSKASMLLALAGTSLTVGLAILARTDLPGAAKVTGWLVVMLIASGVVLLATAVRPALGGNHGFVRYAAATSVADLCEDMVQLDEEQARAEYQLTQLWWLSRAVQRKYRRVRLAVDLLMGGLAATIVTAFLTVSF